MKENEYRGRLIAIDGPNGVGKSTIIKGIQEYFVKEGRYIHITKEPTNTCLGDFVRKYAEKNKGLGLACMVAADRYEHLEHEIIPQLKLGKIVITDRYILSSLILQRMDGVDAEFLFSINNKIIKPDLQVAIFADEKIIQQRLSERKSLTRFEKNNNSNSELKYLIEGISLLKDRKVQVQCIVNNENLEKNTSDIVNYINNL